MKTGPLSKTKVRGDQVMLSLLLGVVHNALLDSIPEKAIITIIAVVLAYDVCFWWE